MEIPKPEAQTKGGSSDRQPQSSERRSSKDKFVLPECMSPFLADA
jgi:hypothetical protein